MPTVLDDEVVEWTTDVRRAENTPFGHCVQFLSLTDDDITRLKSGEALIIGVNGNEYRIAIMHNVDLTKIEE